MIHHVLSRGNPVPCCPNMHFPEEIERIKSVAVDTVSCEWKNYSIKNTNKTSYNYYSMRGKSIREKGRESISINSSGSKRFKIFLPMVHLHRIGSNRRVVDI